MITQETKVAIAKTLTAETPEALNERIRIWKQNMVEMADLFQPETIRDFLDSTPENIKTQLRAGKKPSTKVIASLVMKMLRG